MPIAAMPIDKTEQMLATLRQRAAALERLGRRTRGETRMADHPNLEDILHKATVANRERARAELGFETRLAENVDDNPETSGPNTPREIDPLEDAGA